MTILSNGDWDGVCACGKVEADGKRCKYGATHTRLDAREDAEAAKALTDAINEVLLEDDGLDFLDPDELDFLN